MATRRRKRATAKRRPTARRRNPVRRRRSPVMRTKRRGRSRGRSQRYRRNPVGLQGVLGQTQDLATASVAALVGSAVGRTVSNLVPFGGTPVVDFAKGAAVAILIRTFGERMVGREMARFAAVGAMLGPVKNLVVSFVPQAETFLGRSDQVMYLPSFPRAYAPSLQAYSGDIVSSADVSGDTGSGLDSYAAGYGLSAYTDY